MENYKIQILLNNRDKQIIDSVLHNKLNGDKYKFEDNKLMYISIFSSEKIEQKCYLLNTNINDLSTYLKSIFVDTKNDIEQFFVIGKKIPNQVIVDTFNQYINFLKDNVDTLGFVEASISFFVDKIFLINQEKKIFFCFYIVLLTNILMFFGYYIDWPKKYQNSSVGFWSQYLQLLLEVKSDDLKNRFIKQIIEHLNLNIMDPIYFDNQKDNNNLNEINIFVDFIYGNENIDIKSLINDYESKIKKIDRVLLSILNDIDY